MLPGTLPVLQWFAAERGHTGADRTSRADYTGPMNWLDEMKWDATAWCR